MQRICQPYESDSMFSAHLRHHRMWYQYIVDSIDKGYSHEILVQWNLSITTT